MSFKKNKDKCKKEDERKKRLLPRDNNKKKIKRRTVGVENDVANFLDK